jgi:RHS repeat-associated protein
VPGIPTNINATATHNSATVTWDAMSGATSYDVEFHGITSNTTSTSRTIEDLNSNANHSFRVRASNAGGNGNFSASRAIRTLVAPPIVPTNVRATGVTQTQATVNWDPVTGATSYDVDFDGNVSNTTSTSRAFTGLSPNRNHNFSVRANNAGGSSNFSPNSQAWTRRRPSSGNGFHNRGTHFNGKRQFNAIDPVDAVSGAFYFDYTFLSIDTKDTMEFTIHYNSKNDYNGILGEKWSHSYDYILELRNRLAYFIMPSSETIAFLYDEYTETYTAELGQSNYELTKTSNGYCVSHVDNTEYIFDNNAYLKEIKLNGVTTTYFNVNESGHVTNITGQYGSSFNLSYNDNKIATIKNSLDDTISIVYDNDKLKKAINTEGNRLEFNYDDLNNLIEVSDFSGRVYITNSYTDEEQVNEQNLITQGVSTVEYEHEKNINSFTDELEDTTKYYYDRHGNVTQIQHALGTIKNQYNANRQLIEQIDEIGNVTRMSYDGSLRLSLTIFPNGVSESIAYNNFNLPTKFTNTDETEVNFIYDGKGNLISTRDERDKTEYFVYDLEDNLVSHTDKNGNVSRLTYDNTGQLKTYIDQLGNTYSCTFDSIGRLVYTRTPLGQNKSYKYTSFGNLISILENDEPITFTYDENGNCTSETDKMGNTKRFVYDAMGKLVSETDFLGNRELYSYNKKGLVSQITDPLGHKETIGYDQLGNISMQVDKNGNPTNNLYNEASQLIEIKKPYNCVVKFTYDKRGQVTSTIDPNDNATSFVYDKMGRVLSTTNALGHSLEFTYDNSGNILTETDENNITTKYTYDDESNLLSIESEQGIVRLVYDKAGRLIETWDEISQSELTQYDRDGNIISSRDKEGNLTRFIYNNNGLLSQEVDPLGGITRYEYDKNENCTRVIDPSNNIYLYSYNANNDMTRAVDPMGYETLLNYNSRGEVISTTDANGNRTSYGYDGNGNITRETNPRGGVIEYIYDQLDNLTKITDENGHIKQFSYDKAGNQIEYIDANSNVRTFEYDPINRPVKINESNGSDIRLFYDNKKNIVKIVDQDDAVTMYEYDTRDRVTKIYDSLNNSTEFSYDAIGRLTQYTEANGNETKYTYTPNGNISMITDPEGNRESYTYNAMGFVTQKTDAIGNATNYTYDPLGQVLYVEDAAGNKTNFTYNPKGEIATVTDPRGNMTRYKYDGNNNLVQTTDANGEIFYYEYDSLNNLIKLYSDSNKTPTIYQYDRKGQRIREILPTQADRTFRHDGNGNMISLIDEERNETVYEYNLFDQISAVTYEDGKKAIYRYTKSGHLIELKDWNGVTSIKHDILGRLTKVTEHNGRSTSYDYDYAGNKLSMTYPDGRVVKYDYNKNNQLKTVTDIDNTSTNFEYNRNKDIAKIIQSNGDTTNYSYNSVGLLTNISYMSIEGQRLSNSISHDSAGNIVSSIQTSSTPSFARRKMYNYDKINQLVSYTEDDTRVNYVYDGRGNRIRKTLNSDIETSYGYNSLNQLVSKTEKNKNHIYSYDRRGNLKSEEVNGVMHKTYVFDATDRLVEGNNLQTGEQSKYLYNDFGVRIGIKQLINENKVTSTHTNVLNSPYLVDKNISYVVDYSSYDNNDIMMVEKNGLSSSILYGIGNERLTQRITQVSKNEASNVEKHSNIGINSSSPLGRTHFQSDILSNTVFASNIVGGTVRHIKFDPWGKLITPVSTDVNMLGFDTANRFTGYTYDPVLGKYYAGARFYDDVNGRMISIDPDYADDNLYRYALNNPITYVDTDGRAALLVAGAKKGAAVTRRVVRNKNFRGATRGVARGAARETGRQAIVKGRPNMRGITGAAVGGGVSGGIPTNRARGRIISGAAGAAVGSVVSNGTGNIRRTVRDGVLGGINGAVRGPIDSTMDRSILRNSPRAKKITSGIASNIATRGINGVFRGFNNRRQSSNSNPTISWRNIRPGGTTGINSNRHAIGRVYTSDDLRNMRLGQLTGGGKGLNKDPRRNSRPTSIRPIAPSRPNPIRTGTQRQAIGTQQRR